MKGRRLINLLIVLLANCALHTSKPKNEAEAFIAVQNQTPVSFEATGEWSALGAVNDTTVAKLVKGDTLMQGFFRFTYERGDYRFEIYLPGGKAIAFAICYRDTFTFVSFRDELTLLSLSDNNLSFLGSGLKPLDFPLMFLLFQNPAPADSYIYSEGSIIYNAGEMRFSVAPVTYQVSTMSKNKVKLTYQDYRKVDRTSRPFLVSVEGGFPFPMVDKVVLRMSKQVMNPAFPPGAFAVRPPATKRVLNFLPKEKGE